QHAGGLLRRDLGQDRDVVEQGGDVVEEGEERGAGHAVSRGRRVGGLSHPCPRRGMTGAAATQKKDPASRRGPWSTRGGRRDQKSMPPMPPMPPPGIAGSSFFGSSATIASVVIIRPAIDAAFCSAVRVT